MYPSTTGWRSTRDRTLVTPATPRTIASAFRRSCSSGTRLPLPPAPRPRERQHVSPELRSRRYPELCSRSEALLAIRSVAPETNNLQRPRGWRRLKAFDGQATAPTAGVPISARMPNKDTAVPTPPSMEKRLSSSMDGGPIWKEPILASRPGLFGRPASLSSGWLSLFENRIRPRPPQRETATPPYSHEAPARCLLKKRIPSAAVPRWAQCVPTRAINTLESPTTREVMCFRDPASARGRSVPPWNGFVAQPSEEL